MGLTTEEPAVVMVPVAELIEDASVQPRLGLNEDAVDDYHRAYKRGERLPPLDAFAIGGKKVLVNGYHRKTGAVRAGVKELPVVVHQGDEEAAYEFACRVNLKNGVRFTQAEKVGVVEHFLTNPATRDIGANEFERRTGLSEAMFRNRKNGKVPSPAVPSPKPKDPAKVANARAGVKKRAKKKAAAGGCGSPADENGERKTPEKDCHGDRSRATDAPATAPAVPPEPPPAACGAPAPVLLDARGRPVPAHLVPVFEKRTWFRQMAARISAWLTDVTAEKDEPHMLAVYLQPLQIDAKNLKSGLLVSAPYVVCPRCSGSGKKDGGETCHVCPKACGWIYKGGYTQLTEDMRAVAESFGGAAAGEEAA